MSLFASDLDLRLSLEAAGCLLVLSSVLTVYHLTCLWRSGVFDTMKCALYLLVSFPLTSGWVSLAYGLDLRLRAGLALGMSVIRASALLAFAVVVQRALGRDPTTLAYSAGMVQASIVKIDSAPAWLLCLGGWSLGSVEEAQHFLRWSQFAIGQHAVVLLATGTAGVVLEWCLGEDWLGYAEFSWRQGWVYILGAAGLSASVCTYAVISLGNCLSHSPDKRVASLHSVCTFVTLAVLCTELQELALTGWSQLQQVGSECARAQGFLATVEMAAAGAVQGWVWLPMLRKLTGVTSRVQTVRNLMEQKEFSQVELSGRGRD